MKCKFFFEKGACRMGEKCYYSHEKNEVPSTYPARGGHGGFRGGAPRGGMFSGWGAMTIPPREISSVETSAPIVSKKEDSDVREFFAPTTEKPRMITIKSRQNEKIDLSDLKQQVSRINSDLVRLEPVRRRMNAG